MPPLFLCARHGRYLGSARLLWAMTRRTTSEGQLRKRERTWGGSLEQSLDLMKKNCVKRHRERGKPAKGGKAQTSQSGPM